MSKQARLSDGPIVWALDPLEAKTASRAPLAKFLKTISRELSQKVLPFSVISPSGSSWPIPVEYNYGKELQASGKKEIRNSLRKLKWKNVSAPTVEVHSSSSRRELVNDVLRFSKERHASFIAVNTQRLLASFPRKIGGFAEALIGKSPLPVIAVSPNAEISTEIKSILFPTDFSKKSQLAFGRAVELARRLKAHLILVHRDDAPLPDFIGFTTEPLPILEARNSDMREKEAKKTLARADQWCKKARQAGVSCEYRSEEKSISVSEAILNAAKVTHADLIVMPSYRKTGFLALMGGTARDVLSKARIPVVEIQVA